MNDYNNEFREFLNKYDISDEGTSGYEKIVLIILLCNITQSIRVKNKDTRVIDVIDKIIKDDELYFRKMLTNICFICECLLLGIRKDPFPDLGLKDTKEKVEKIKEILNKYLPF